MARKSPLELRRLALYMYRQGMDPVRIADLLGLHPGSVHSLVTGPCGPSRQQPARRALGSCRY